MHSRLEGALTQVALFSRSDILLHCLSGLVCQRLLGLLLHHLVLIETLDLLAGWAGHDVDLDRLGMGVLHGRHASAIVFLIMHDLSTSNQSNCGLIEQMKQGQDIDS